MTVHAERAGFAVVRSGSGWVALTGPGLTEGVDESALTANALWEAVTGKPGTQDWYESVKVIVSWPGRSARRRTTPTLTARKIYSSGSPALRWMVVWARTDEPNPRVGGFLVRADTPGIHHRTELGITSDCSPASAIHDVVFDRVVVPADAVAGLATPDSPARRSLAGVSGLRS